MTIFISDTFTDTNGIFLKDHAPETGGEWILRLGFNGAEINSNQARSTQGAGAVYHTNDTPPPSANYNIEFDWNNVDDTGTVLGVIGRFLDNSNGYFYYKFQTGSSQFLKLLKIFGGQNTQLDSDVESLVSGTEAGKFELSGATQKGFAGGVEKVSGTDSDLTLPGFAGIYMSGDNSIQIDNYIANDTSTPASTNASMQPINVWWQLD